MSRYYVICITKKPDHAEPHTSIESYGLATDPLAKVGTERWTQQRMINVLENKEHVVKSLGTNPKTGSKEFVELEVVTHSNGTKYVKSKNDGDKPDNLLEQRDCDIRDAK